MVAFYGLFNFVGPSGQLTYNGDISLLFNTAGIQSYLLGLSMILLSVLFPIIVSRMGVRGIKFCIVALSVPLDSYPFADSTFILS